MKELLSISGSSIVVALNDRAYAILQSDSEKLQLVELSPPTSVQKYGENENAQPQKQNENENANSVEAVASKWLQDKKILLCAVSRYDKYVSVYSLSLDESLDDADEDKVQVEPVLVAVHKTNKRSCALAFADIPYEDKSKGSLDILVTADLAGDVQAFPTATAATGTSKSKKVHRLLLGHTASMLTAMKIVNGKIFTADRDEKVRISSFPQTFNVEGYLLGNTEYVTDMDVFGTDYKYCVTSSGDCSIRLWDTDKCTELAHVNVASEEDTDANSNAKEEDAPSEGNSSDDEKAATKKTMQIPVRVAASKSGSLISVIYHDRNTVDLFAIEIDGNSARMEKVQSIECQNPLAVAFDSKDELCVLTKEPDFMVRFAKNPEGNYAELKECKISSAIREIGGKNQIIMPTSIVDIDEVTGTFKLQKNVHDERETYVEHKPWLRGNDRVQKHKDKERRRKKRKWESRQGSAAE